IEGVGCLEAGVARDVDVAETHAGEPHEEIADAVGQLVLAIRRHRHQHRHALAFGRAEDIRAELRAVAHRHGDVALEADAGGAQLLVAHGAIRLAGSILCSMRPWRFITSTQNLRPCGLTFTSRLAGMVKVAAACGGSFVYLAIDARTESACAGSAI